MNQYGGYVSVKVGDISLAKLKKALEGSTVRLAPKELSGDRVMLLHPLNAKKINAAKKSKKGITTSFTRGEVEADLEYHNQVGAGMHGGSLWSWLKKKAYPFVKDNWNLIKPIVTKAVDAAVPAIATYAGQPNLAIPAREAIRQVSGVGMKKSKKGSPEMKAKMAAIRAMKGGSFRAP